MLAETSEQGADGINRLYEGTSNGHFHMHPKVSPEHIIIISDDDSDADNDARVPVPPIEPATLPALINTSGVNVAPTYFPQADFAAPEPLLLSPSNTNMYLRAADNTSHSNFDPEIFDMQLTAQGGFLNIAVIHGFKSKRRRKRAAKRRI